MWWVLVGFLTGRGLRDASLPDAEKQRRFDAAQARRATKRSSQNLTTGQWIIVVLFVLIVIGLVIQGVEALFGG